MYNFSSLSLTKSQASVLGSQANAENASIANVFSSYNNFVIGLNSLLIFNLTTLTLRDSVDNMSKNLNKLTFPVRISKSSNLCDQMDSKFKEKENINVLDSLLKLPRDWDDEGAVTIDYDAYAKTREIVTKLKYQPDIFPLPSGGVHLEYSNNKDDILNIDVYNDSVLMIYGDNKGKTEVFAKTDTSQINEFLERMFDNAYYIRAC